MKKFIFSLQTLLEVRQKQENIALKELLDARLILQKTLAMLEELEKLKNSIKDEIRYNEARSFNPYEAGQYFQHLRNIKRRIANQERYVLEAKESMEQKRKLLTQAIQKRKMIENLQEKKFTEWEHEIQSKDQAFFDELATIRFLRDKKV